MRHFAVRGVVLIVLGRVINVSAILPRISAEAAARAQNGTYVPPAHTDTRHACTHTHPHTHKQTHTHTLRLLSRTHAGLLRLSPTRAARVPDHGLKAPRAPLPSAAIRSAGADGRDAEDQEQYPLG